MAAYELPLIYASYLRYILLASMNPGSKVETTASGAPQARLLVVHRPSGLDLLSLLRCLSKRKESIKMLTSEVIFKMTSLGRFKP